MSQDTLTSQRATDQGPADPAPRASLGRRALTVLGLLLLAASAIFGGNVMGVRERVLGSETPEARSAAASREATPTETTPAPRQTVVRSSPWWQRVTSFQGEGPMTTPPFTIDAGAIQWRITWSCSSGHLTVQGPDRSRSVVDAGCPGASAAYVTKMGTSTLDVNAQGAWQLQVDQQVDIPLNEPPLPAMTAPGSKPLATGAFYRIDQVGRGAVTIYALADGTHALRLDDIYISPNIDLEIHLSPLASPRTTEQYLSAPSTMVARLDVTAGSMNFVLPKGVDPRRYRSLVIWCPPVRSAYAAAALNPVRVTASGRR